MGTSPVSDTKSAIKIRPISVKYRWPIDGAAWFEVGGIIVAHHLEEILADFNALNSNDYDFGLGNWEGQQRVRELCDEVLTTPHPEQAMPTMFAVFERLFDADFGAPGALVHTLEQLPDYELELIASVRRKPTYYTIWMVNRILNGLSADAARNEQHVAWMNLLKEVLFHPLADEGTKQDASDFIGFQQTRTAR